MSSRFKMIVLSLVFWLQMLGPLSVNAAADEISICSFNIQFLGNSAKRDNANLAQLLKDYDIVVVQEVVAPPFPSTFPNGEPFRPQPKTAGFFDQMKQKGFSYWLSEEDTGTGDTIHTNSTATEWWVAFYKPDRVSKAVDLPWGFLAKDRSNNNHYERVPYAFAFRSADGKEDLVLISVHLQPNGGKVEAARRKHELSTIAKWIDDHNQTEKDFIVLGDMNIQSKAELEDATPAALTSLNGACQATNTNPGGPKPYDHVLYNTVFTQEIDTQFGFQVINLVAAMKPLWHGAGSYPGSPTYYHDRFRAAYSDHNPIVFRLVAPEADDD